MAAEDDVRSPREYSRARSVTLKLPQRVLELPRGFDLYQRVVGAPGAKRRFIEEFVRPRAGERVLDVGCGTGALCSYMPRGVEYVGVDVDARYVETARERYLGRGEFVCADIADLPETDVGSFDVAIAFGVVHHLADEQVRTALAVVRALLRPGGRLLASEPCLTDAAGRAERFLMEHDRGRFIRAVDDYVALAESAFPRVSARVVPGTYRIPFSVVVLEGRTG
jgi:cyclopropane fatty-acyl-phospholipid synthase-like methyltransferase